MASDDLLMASLIRCASLELLGATSPAERDKMEVRRFLNRLLGLPLREQNDLFDLFCATLSGVISAARKDGKYDEGIADLSGASVSLEEPETALWSDPLTGAVMRTALVLVDRGVSWHAACEKLAARLALDGQQQQQQPTTTTTTTSAVAGAIAGRQCVHSNSARVPRSLVRAGSMRRPRDVDEEEEEGEGEGEDEGMSDFIVDDDAEEAEEEEESAARGNEEVGEDEDEEVGEDEGEEAHSEAAAAEEAASEEEAAAAAAAEAAAAAVAPADVELNEVELEEVSDDDEEDDAHPRARGAPATARRKPPPKGADHCTGFHRSRFLQAGERLYVLALPRANRAGLYLLTRPSTGDSPFEEEEVRSPLIASLIRVQGTRLLRRRCEASDGVGWRRMASELPSLNLMPPFPSFSSFLAGPAAQVREDLAGGGAPLPFWGAPIASHCLFNRLQSPLIASHVPLMVSSSGAPGLDKLV